jgi:hypothetical protein
MGEIHYMGFNGFLKSNGLITGLDMQIAKIQI